MTKSPCERRTATALLLAVLVMRGVARVDAQSTAARSAPRGGSTPDLNGIWQAVNSAAWNVADHSAEEGVPAGAGVVGGGVIPYQPWALAKQKENYANRAKLDPLNQCYLPGVPRSTYIPFPFQIIQTPGVVVIAHEFAHVVRTIYADGSSHPEGLGDFWMGDSRGRWEGNTLIVDSTGFNDQTWFDSAGNFHSEALHVVERFTKIGNHHIQYDVTIEDPKVFVRPWTMSMPLYRRFEKNIQLLDYECVGFIEQRLPRKEPPPR